MDRKTSKDATNATIVGSCICGCGGGACIPQREYDREKADPLSQSELQEVILFSVDGKCGYPLKLALNKRYTGLDGRDEKMFVDSKSAISIRVEVRPSASSRYDYSLESCLQWLPYEKWTKQVGADSRVSLYGHY